MFLELVRLSRTISLVPINFIIFTCYLYVKILFFLDLKNYSKDWEEKLQKYIDKTKSKNIYITKNKFVKFNCPNTISSFRSLTLFSKEPETINWLNRNGSKDKILYDIGANMGIYSIYYSKKFNSKSYCFEPSFKNLVALSKNINLNKLNKVITIVPNAVTNVDCISNFYQSNFVEGNASAIFNDKNIERNIKKNLKKNFSPIEYNTLGLNIDNLVKNKILKLPDLIKIDVDGNELDVLLGLSNILKKKRKLTILIEIDGRLKTGNIVHKLLKKFKYKIVDSKNDNFIFEKKI